MRLTLRTLLAYMDDILEPADHEDLGNKIEASDFATELIHRSRDTVRRLRLGAPAVLSEDSDDVLDSLNLADANAVAEYLDNTLPPEQVAEFERMCLEPGTQADMHLAEVASCHHVLTMVLGEPAEVDPELKSQMYKLAGQDTGGQKLRIEPTHAASTAAAPVAAPPVQTAAPTAPPQPEPMLVVPDELPDYLKEAAAAKRRSRRWAIGTIAVAVGLIGLWLANPPAPELPEEMAAGEIEALDAGEIDIQGLELDTPTASSTIDAASAEPAPPFDPNEAAAEPAPAFVPNANTADQPAPAFDPGNASNSNDSEAVESGAEQEMLDSLEEGATELDSGGDSVVTASVDVEPPMELPTTDQADLAPQAGDGEVDASDAVSSGEEPVLIASTPQQPIPSELPVDSTDSAEAAEEQPAGPQRLGNYLGNNDVLLIHNVDQGNWIRLPPRSPISTGDQLLTLPKFFTHVVLADINTYLSGGTQVRVPLQQFEAATSEPELNLEVVYGRVMFNAGLNGSKVAILVDDQLREFQLDGSASLAVDVQRVFVPGNDYENQVAPTIATWYLTSGNVEWPTATGGTQTISGQMAWKTIDGVDEIPEAVSALPEWIGREPMTDMERSARDDLAKELNAGNPVEIRLLELTDGKGLGRRKEVRVLSAESSIFVGEFEPLVKALNDSDQSRAWDEHIRVLRQAMALSPNVASGIREAFVRIRGEQAAQELFEMVQGYNLDQIGETRVEIQAGALSQLIKWLDHDSLDYRVLAIDNIRAITGKDKGYRADDSLKGRKKNLRKILAEFESNELFQL